MAKEPTSEARHHRGAARWVILALAVAVGLLMLSPFVIMALNALKSPQDYSTNGPLSIPTSLYTDGLVAFWNRTEFPLKLWNSILISSAVAFLACLLSLVTAYAIGIGRVRGRVWLIAVFLIANMLPQEALIYPLFSMANAVGMSNSRIAIIIFMVIQSAFGIYLLSSVLGTFPKELLEAAAIDGAGRFRILWQVVYPILKPTLGVLMVFFFIWTWNEFFIPLVLLTTNETQTVPIALASLQGDRMMDAPTTNAGALLSLLPALVFFLIFQRTLTRGVTAGAVK
jgi:raffinose/stachyose/melibiose transport system permease protein